MPRNVGRHRYLIGVGVFGIGTTISMVGFILERQYVFITFLGTMVGFFIFMILDRVEQVDLLERLNESIQKTIVGSILAQATNDGRSSQIIRMTSTEANDYTLARICNVRRMYNTSFTLTDSVATAAYRRWLHAIVDNVVARDCIVNEVMSSPVRLGVINERLEASKASQLGEYSRRLITSNSPSFILPYVETCIFENTDGKLEVLFGWSSNTSHYMGDDVFWSKDENLCKLFLAYFRRIESLADAAHSVVASGSAPNRPGGG